MKKLTLLLLLFTSIICKAQDDVYGKPKPETKRIPNDEILSLYPTQNGKVVYEKVIQITGITKEALYSASNKWLSDAFRSAKSVVESQDQPSGQIIGWAYGDLPPVNESALIYTLLRLKFHIQINCKDDKARIRFYNINMHIIAASRDVSEINTPIEQAFESSKKLSSNKKAKATVTANRINKYFENLITSFSESLDKSAKDDF